MKKMSEEPLITGLQKIIRVGVRGLAILMTLVIFWGIADVAWLIYKDLTTPPVGILNLNEILGIFGAFMAVLIGIEIFINIIVYLRDEVIHVKIVLATALVAIARKVIVLDFSQIDSKYVWATSSVILALGISYWLIAFKTQEERKLKTRDVEI